MPVSNRLFIFTLLFCVFSGTALAGNISYAGTFINDNDVQLFTFNLPAPSTVTLLTLGYGGGVNAAGQTIAAGGFEPVLGLFDSTGVALSGPIQPGNNNPPCSPRNPDPARDNFCLDAYAQFTLGAGSYTVSLSQSPNDPLGNLSDGFFYVNAVPDPNFNNGFVGSFGLQGTGNWALDILNVDTGAPTPEPTTGALAALGVAVAIWRGRRATT